MAQMEIFICFYAVFKKIVFAKQSSHLGFLAELSISVPRMRFHRMNHFPLSL